MRIFKKSLGLLIILSVYLALAVTAAHGDVEKAVLAVSVTALLAGVIALGVWLLVE